MVRVGKEVEGGGDVIGMKLGVKKGLMLGQESFREVIGVLSGWMWGIEGRDRVLDEINIYGVDIINQVFCKRVLMRNFQILFRVFF